MTAKKIRNRQNLESMEEKLTSELQKKLDYLYLDDLSQAFRRFRMVMTGMRLRPSETDKMTLKQAEECIRSIKRDLK